MEFFIYILPFPNNWGKKRLLQGDWNCKKIPKISSQAICWKLFQSNPTETFWWPKKPTPFLLLLRFSIFLCPWDRTLVTFWSKTLIQKSQPPPCLQNKELKRYSLFSASLPGHLLQPQMAKYFPPANPHSIPEILPGLSSQESHPILRSLPVLGPLTQICSEEDAECPQRFGPPAGKGHLHWNNFIYILMLYLAIKLWVEWGRNVRQENSRQSKIHWQGVKLNLWLTKDWEDSLIFQGLAGGNHW